MGLVLMGVFRSNGQGTANSTRISGKRSRHETAPNPEISPAYEAELPASHVPHHRPCRCGAQGVVAPFALFRRARSGVRGTRRLQRVIQGRLPNLDSCSGLANIQVVGDMFLGPLQLPRGDHGLAPASSGGSQSRAGPVTDEVPLKLPQGAEHGKISRPPDVVVSMLSDSDRNPTPRASSAPMTSIRCGSERPRRSSRRCF